MGKQKTLHGDGWLEHFRKCMDEFAGTRRKYDVFTDFIELALDAFLSDHTPEHPNEKSYMHTISRYSRDEAMLFSDMLGCVIGYTCETGKECLGTLWEEYAASSQLGQFFTPQNICELVNMIALNGIEMGKYDIDNPCRISDPSCGVGRMLAMALTSIPAEHRDKVFLHGIDIDGVVCKAAALNMLLLDANSVIVHGNTLSLEAWNAYETNRTGMGFARIREIKDVETLEKLMAMGLRRKDKSSAKPVQMELEF